MKDDLYNVPQAAANSFPLSFTLTSVLRTTAADRKDSDHRLQSLVPEVKVGVTSRQQHGAAQRL